MERPTKPYEEVRAMLGAASSAWEKLLGYIRYHYEMDEKWAEGKPTHKHYNNLFVRRSCKSFIGLSLRDGFFFATVTLGKDEQEKFDVQRDVFAEAVLKQYDEAEALHDGKWLGFEVRDESLIGDIINLLLIKRKPNRKVMPDSLEKCGCLEIGLSHDEITNRLFGTN